MTAGRKILNALRDTVVILLITLVSLEIGLRVFHYFSPLPIFYDNSYNRFRMSPHVPIYGFSTNSKGFHDVERSKEKPAGTYRALGIGDSFSFGVVPHQFNYLTLLENHIKATRPEFELVNMGIPGLSPREYLAVLLNEGLELKPDMVLLSFFIGNDFAETAKIDRIYRWSYTANIVKYVYALKTKAGNLGGTTTSAYDDNAPPLTEDAFLQIEAFGKPLFEKDNPLFDEALARTMVHLRAIKQVCDGYGIRLSIVLIPDVMQLDDGLLRKVTGLAPDRLDPDRPNRALSAELTRLGVDHLDLTAAFRAAAPSGRLYKPNDIHWNIAGNALAEKLIYEHISEKIPSGAGR